ncbi:DnaJ domain-containing protein [Agromyces seonyuensis]|uniref:DnaJ domain-containing protein n=1 Tax=Agromyces seonyuensis TaxID=2662446 RepID=A0A6I4P2I0_9MICO|nr:DnaJ domain-containing protein [Agromyces seonyuensis]MWB99822.1 DnaJ domain-containing protein [Agromyces seonyuensis]
MPESPMAESPYEVLGVAPTVDEAALKRAYRRALRAAHPDTGGSTTRFDQVQRAWELVGTPDARADFDRGGRRGDDGVPDAEQWAPRAPSRPAGSRVSARAYGHPGGWSREWYLERIREWVGRGVEIANPYDQGLVHSAPAEIRHLLANALAEEATAVRLSDLGIGFTVWHDLATEAAGRHAVPKLDHLVLGPTGLIAVQSEDWGRPVHFKRGELFGAGIPADEHPVKELAARAKDVTRRAKVKPTALVIVVPDDHAAVPIEIGGAVRGVPVALVRRSRLASAIREGIHEPNRKGAPILGGLDAMEVRKRLQDSVVFAE